MVRLGWTWLKGWADMKPLADAKRYILEAFKQHEDGLTTQGEALSKILYSATVSMNAYLMESEEVYFKATGKRPYELGL